MGVGHVGHPFAQGISCCAAARVDRGAGQVQALLAHDFACRGRLLGRPFATSHGTRALFV